MLKLLYAILLCEIMVFFESLELPLAGAIIAVFITIKLKVKILQ